MFDRTRLTRLALAAATLSGFLAACSKPADDVQAPAGAEAAPVASAEPAPPPPAPAALPEQAAEKAAAAAPTVTTINLSNCETTSSTPNRPQTSIVDYQSTDPNLPAEVRWMKQGNGQGLKVTIKPLGDQSPAILGMFDARYEIPADGESVLSGLPRNPPFNGGNEVRWKYQVQVVNPQGKVICGVDPDVCVRGGPGGCSN